MNTTDLLTEATALPLEERAQFADALLQTFNPVDDAASSAWLALARRRLDEIDSGRVTTIPGVAVFEEAARRLAK